MARISYTKYANSKIATACSAVASVIKYMSILMVVLFIVEAFNTGLTEDTVSILLVSAYFFINGILLEKCGQRINDRKIYKLWLVFISENGYIEAIKNDVSFAKTVYDNCPNKKCQKYVILLNNGVTNM